METKTRQRLTDELIAAEAEYQITQVRCVRQLADQRAVARRRRDFKRPRLWFLFSIRQNDRIASQPSRSS